MTRPLALDLFCGAGGASMGLHRAGFDVVGVDIKPQRRYPFRFVRADALRPPFDIKLFDFIWASPPCQRYVIVWRGQEHKRQRYPDLIAPTRSLLASSGARMTCIENVPGAPLRPDVVLTGAQFDLDIVRSRLFELNGFCVPFTLSRQHVRKVSDGGLACVAGHGANNAWNVRRQRGPYTKWRDLPDALKRRLRERNCATRNELREAVPPAYAEFIGRAAIEQMQRRRAA
jgi:DNA (cytosine-5)-methyltransferase 1